MKNWYTLANAETGIEKTLIANGAQNDEADEVDFYIALDIKKKEIIKDLSLFTRMAVKNSNDKEVFLKVAEKFLDEAVELCNMYEICMRFIRSNI